MEILGIGVPEFVFILLIALIVLGPKDMQKAGKTIGTWMRKVVMSSEWQSIRNASKKLKTLPNQLMREANLDDITSSFETLGGDIPKTPIPDKNYGSWGGGSPHQNLTDENSIAPPQEEKSAPAQKEDASQKNPSVNDADSIEIEDA